MATFIRTALSGALSFTGFNADDPSSLFVAVSDATVEQNNNLQRDDVEGLVDNLNSGYVNGKPSDDYSEAGIFLHMLDGIYNPYSPDNKGDYNLANTKSKKFFMGTSEHPDNIATALVNEKLSSPASEKYGEEVYIFHSWDSIVTFGPAAGLVYYPCAVEQSIRCMFPIDGSSDGRPLGCSRVDLKETEEFFYPFMSISDCAKCFDSDVVPGKDNIVDGRVLRYSDKVGEEQNLTNYEIELIFNRHIQKSYSNNMAKHGDKPYLTNLTDDCKSCEASLMDRDDELSNNTNLIGCYFHKEISCGKQFFNYLFSSASKWYEGLGYYGTIPEKDNVLIKPKSELKAMLEAQTTYFGLNQDYSDFRISQMNPSGPVYNEIDINANLLNSFEHNRASSSLGYDGIDESSGQCGGSIKALVLICGDQEDPFYYGEPGTCLDKDSFASLYKDFFKKEDAPQVVYFNLKNFTHPFSLTCDMTPSCGVKSMEEGADENDDKDDTQPKNSVLAPQAAPFKVLALLMGVLTMVHVY